MTREDWHRIAEAEVTEYQRRGEEYAELAAKEFDLESGRAIEKDAAIRRIMAQPNPLNSDKPHSATSAEKIVETDPEYADYLKHQRDIVREKNIAFTHMTSAKLRAELAIAAVRASQEVAA